MTCLLRTGAGACSLKLVLAAICQIHYARAYVRIMRADTCAHTCIKFVNNKPPPPPSTHASPHPLPPSSSWRSSAVWRRTQPIASTPCHKGAAARMRSDNNYRPLTTKHKHETCIKYVTHSPAASSTAAPSSTCCTLPLTLQPNFSNTVRRCNLVPLPNSAYRVTRACPTSGCASHFILQ